MHDIFENLDFSSLLNETQLSTETKHILNEYGLFDFVDQNQFQIDILRICSKGLGGPLNTRSLSNLPAKSWIPELEFDMRFETTNKATQGFKLAMQLWAGQDPTKVEYINSFITPNIRTLDLTGAIDLVFKMDGKWYIADYKSNRCRKDPNEKPSHTQFSKDALITEILSHHYPFQYIIYSLALHRFLQLRLGSDYDYSRDFGGVYYLFLRGMSFEGTEKGHGVYFDRVPNTAIQTLDNCFKEWNTL